jgi:pimeloyl-ACP methyl ester carboxylesterase
MRFSYRGQGHSEGQTSDLGFATALEDAVAVIEHFKAMAEVDELIVLGTRLGGIVAAGAARHVGAQRLIVNDPIPTGSGWIRELSRADRVQAMSETDVEYVLFADRIERDGMADVLGFAFHGPLVPEAPDHDLLTEIHDDLSAALFVQFGRPDKIAKGLTKVSAALDERGIDVTVTGVSEEEGWWASRRGDYFVSETVRPLTTELVPIIVDWVTQR